MIPIRDIRLGDQFQNPMLHDGLIFSVEEINYEENMIKVQGYSYNTCLPVSKPFWKKNSDSMFSESWRINKRHSVAEDKEVNLDKENIHEEAREATARQMYKAVVSADRGDIGTAIILRVLDDWYEKVVSEGRNKQLRRCEVYEWETHSTKKFIGIGIFHQFGVDYEEFESGTGNFTIAIVEMIDGTVRAVPLENIKFCK